MLPSMPSLLLTPMKEIGDVNKESESVVQRSSLTLPTRDLFVNTTETEHCQLKTDVSTTIITNNNNAVMQSSFSPPSIEVQTIINKKYVSPRQAKTTTRQKVLDFTGKKIEVYQKQNQHSSTLQSLLIPVNQFVTTMDTEIISPTNTASVGQDVEMTEVDFVPNVEKLVVEVGQCTENNSLSSPQQAHKVEGKEGTVKGKTSSSVSARRTKKQKELEAAISALKPETAQVKEERATSYAQTYFMKVKERLDDTVYSEFVQELVNFKDSNSMDAASLYTRMETLLSPHKDLIDEFLAFLLPDQAKQVGRLMDYLLCVKMKDFINKLELLLTKQSPQVYASLEQLASQPNVSLSDVHNAILPHLKSSPLLTDYFLELLPGERPPDSLMIDYELADCIEGDEEICYEMIQVPDFEDPYGGEHCPCKCHKTQNFHCITCGIKYINGKVYLQHGKIIRSAKVFFEKEDQEKMHELKWRGRGEPEIGYSRYHRRRYLPSPAKAPDHSGSTKKSPRTPRTKTVTSSKPKNLKSSKMSCSAKGLPLMEGIMPLGNKSEFNDGSETETRNSSDIDKEIKSFVNCADNKPSDVQFSDQKSCPQNFLMDVIETSQDFTKNTEKQSNSISVEENVVKNIEEDMMIIKGEAGIMTIKEEDVMMSIEEEDTKSPTCSQIADIPSVISPMSFYSESLHSNSGFELINKQNTIVHFGDSQLHSESSQPMSFNKKSQNLLTSEKGKDDAERMDISDSFIDTSVEDPKKICLTNIVMESSAKVKDVFGEEMSFTDIKTSHTDHDSLLMENKTSKRHELYFGDTGFKCTSGEKHDSDRFPELMDKGITNQESNMNIFSSLDLKIDETVINRSESPIKITVTNPDELETGNKTSNVEQKIVIESEARIESCSVVSMEQNKVESILFKSESKKHSLIVQQRRDNTEVLEQQKLTKECKDQSVSQSSVISEQRKDTNTPELPCWTREEDKIILQAFQQEGDTEQTFIKINQLLPLRTVKEIQNRFQVLLILLQQMTGVSEDSGR